MAKFKLRYLFVYAPLSVLTYNVGKSYYDFHYPPAVLPKSEKTKKLVILGTGWASTSLVKNLWSREFDVTVISPRNYFLFTPLLPQVSLGGVDSRSIMLPIRYILRKKPFNVQFLEADCTSIDPFNKTVKIVDNSEVKGLVVEKNISYDYLVVGVGADNATFGIKGVEENALFLKEVQDTRLIRRKIQDCLETSEFQDSIPEKQRLLSAVVVGGGPTGVEFAGELYDFLSEDIKMWFPNQAEYVKITLIEALPKVLPSFSKKLVDYTEQSFKDSNIEILTNTQVKEVLPRGVLAVDKTTNKEILIPYGVLIWATGNTPRPLIKKLIELAPKEQTSRRGLTIDDNLQVTGFEDIFAFGDCTVSKNPPTAQVAYQQGKYLAKLFNEIGTADLNGRDAKFNKFVYSHLGGLAYIGGERSIGDFNFAFGNYTLDGIVATLVWNSVYLTTLFSFRNQVLVGFDWAKHRLFGRDIGRE